MKTVLMGNFNAFVAIIVILQMAGCTGIQTFSNTARTGDTIAVAIGPSVGSDYIKTSDITAVVVDSLGNRYPVKVRHVSRVYADPTSIAAIGGWGADFFPIYQGQWIALVDLIDPVNSSLPPLAEGQATLELTDIDPTVDLYDPSLVILPGRGSPHSLYSTDYTYFSPLTYLYSGPHIAVEAQGTSSTIPAGATFVFHYDTSKFPPEGNEWKLRVTKLSQDPNIQLLSSIRDIGGGVSEMTVIIMNPQGFSATSTWDLVDGASLPRDLTFVLTWAAYYQSQSYQPVIGTDLSLVSSEYIDINGDVINTLTASLGGGWGYITP